MAHPRLRRRPAWPRHPLMEALAGVVDIESTPQGTRVRMSWPLDAFPAVDGTF
ncbi:hypothetical protein GCM10017788_26540 [Amycolatopsis acidiphila]|nr:hypothetical protein GCM10017788_26540 [Amycolatopsis acidiphila]